MYSNRNYPTKKALLNAVLERPVPCHQPGPFGPDVADGEHCCEGPHYPAPHRWYASVRVKDGMIVAVKDSRGKWVEAPQLKASATEAIANMIDPNGTLRARGLLEVIVIGEKR